MQEKQSHTFFYLLTWNKPLFIPLHISMHSFCSYTEARLECAKSLKEILKLASSNHCLNALSKSIDVVCGSFQSSSRQEYSPLIALVKDKSTLTALGPFWSSKINHFKLLKLNARSSHQLIALISYPTQTSHVTFILGICRKDRSVLESNKTQCIFLAETSPPLYWSTSAYPATPPATKKQLGFLALSPIFILLSTINKFKQIPLTSPTVGTICRNTSSPIASTVFEKDKVKLGQDQKKGSDSSPENPFMRKWNKRNKKVCYFLLLKWRLASMTSRPVHLLFNRN